MVTTAVDALLVVQNDDVRLRAIEARREELMPPVRNAEAVLAQVAQERDRTARALEKERTRAEQGEQRLVERRRHLDHWTERLGEAVKIADATAAAEQVEAGRRAVAELESDVAASTRRAQDLRSALTAHDASLREAETACAEARRQTGAVIAALEAELQVVQAERAAHAAQVDRTLLSLYDRVSTRRRETVLYALNPNFTCGACDTAIPLQRRPAFVTGGAIEPCEGCGVLLYHREAATPTATAS